MDHNGNILFTDIPNNRIMVYNPASGRVGVFREPSGRANGLEFDAQGRLLACEGDSTDGGRRVSRTEKDGSVVALADSYNGKRLNSPNDLHLDSRGNITRVLDDVQRPNGILISADNKTLYLADNNNEEGGNKTLNAYDILSDGRVANKRILHDFAPGRGIDGMAIDAEGNIYATAGSGDQAGVYVFSPQGKQLTFIKTPEDPTNCAFGGPDRSTLYITAGQSLYRIRLNARGRLIYPLLKQ